MNRSKDPLDLSKVSLEKLITTYQSLIKIDVDESEVFLATIEEHFETNLFKERVAHFQDFFELSLLFEREENLINRFFDACIGLRKIGNKTKLAQLALEKEGKAHSDMRVRGSFNYAHTQSHYSALINVFNYLRPGPGDKIVDIGAGFGRLAAFIGLCFPKTLYCGYELISDRVNCAKEVISRNHLEGVEVVTADVLSEEFNLPEADIYYFYDPLELSGLEIICNKLERKPKPFKLVALSGYDEEIIKFFNSKEWLTPIRSVQLDYYKQEGQIYQAK